AHDREAIEGHVLDEGAECVLHGIESTEMIEMLRIDVGDNGYVRGQLQKRAVGFIGLDNHPIAGAQPCIGAVRIDEAAVYHRWVETASIEQGRNKRSRGCFAMGAGYRHTAFQPHQFRQHLGAPHDWQTPWARGEARSRVCVRFMWYSDG